MEPILFHPILQTRRWGGDKLATQLGKTLPNRDEPFGESWEIVDRHDQQSKIANGAHAGKTIRELMESSSGEILGTKEEGAQFPFLIKFLDCQDDLSVQVHPNDEQAKTYHPSETGKTEAWIILDADPGSLLYAGFKPGTTPDQIRTAIQENRLQDLLKTYSAQLGDCFFIPAGTVHAIGAGLVVAEIQQPSDLTFRLYDWGFLDKNGNPRQLHVDDGLASMVIDEDFDPRFPSRPDHDSATEPAQSITSPYFQIDVFQFSEDTLQLDHEEHCYVLMVLGGSGTLRSGDHTAQIELGQTWLLPACNKSLSITPSSPLKVALVHEPGISS